jgi:aconitate hydratase
VVPPGTGICHQVNLEYLAQAVWLGDDEGQVLPFLIPWWEQIHIPP